MGEETGRFRKLSRPWHGPYRITSCDNTGMSAVKVYFPREDTVKVHQTRVKPCPDGQLAGYYWYGSKRKGQAAHLNGLRRSCPIWTRKQKANLAKSLKVL